MRITRNHSDNKPSKSSYQPSYHSRSKQAIARIKQIYQTQNIKLISPNHFPIKIKCKTNPSEHQSHSKEKNSTFKTQISSKFNLKIKIPIKSRTPNTKSPIALSKRSQNKFQTPQHEPLTQRPAKLEELRRKVNDSKMNFKMIDTQKYFRKQKQKQNLPQKYSLNQTLKMVWQKKAKKASKTQFRMIKSLGKSQAGDIIQAFSNNTGLVAAIKTFRKNELKLQFLIDQMKIHLYCQHPNILPAYGYNIGRDDVYLVMEVGECNLYDRIVRYAPYDEITVGYYISQVAAGVAYLHQSGIMHRDIKPQNIIFFGDCLKIADFGWSIQASKPRKTLCGTLDYLSPEVAKREYYNNKIDCWSIGVLMYQLLTGQPPFPEQKQTLTDFQDFIIPNKLSQPAKDLLLNLLCIDPIQRITSRAILQHQWIVKCVRRYQSQRKTKFKHLFQQVNALFK